MNYDKNTEKIQYHSSDMAEVISTQIRGLHFFKPPQAEAEKKRIECNKDPDICLEISYVEYLEMSRRQDLCNIYVHFMQKVYHYML